MRTAIAQCERVDEIKSLADKAVALRAYFAQSRDVENELAAMRIRLRAERRLGELIAAEQAAGRLAAPGGDGRNQHGGPSSATTTLGDIGIPRDRSARAQELARVPAEQFEAALQTGKPSARSIAALAPPKGSAPASRTPQPIDVQPVLKTWGTIRDFAAAIKDESLLHPWGWTTHPGIQPFQIAEIRDAIEVIRRYLTALENYR